MSNTISATHFGNIGDAWSAIPAMREISRKTKKKIVLYLEANHLAEYYAGATHPTKNDEGDFVCLNEKMIEMMIPLFKVQPFIEDVKIRNGEKVDWDLNLFRMISVGLPNTSINRWYFYAFPDSSCDLSKPWLHVPKTEKNFAREKILINRTERYINHHISFEFLKPYEDDCLFIGTMREYNNFCMGNDLNIRKLNVNNFLEYAQAIDQSDFYISNQSQGYQLCQGIFHPSILEVCTSATNVTPVGENMYDFVNQAGLVHAFHKLNGTLSAYVEMYANKDMYENKKATNEAALDKVNNNTD